MKFGKKILRESDVEAVLQRLDRLTLEEARATGARTLEVVYRLFKKIKGVMNSERCMSVLYAVLNVALQIKVS